MLKHQQTHQVCSMCSFAWNETPCREHDSFTPSCRLLCKNKNYIRPYTHTHPRLPAMLSPLPPLSNDALMMEDSCYSNTSTGYLSFCSPSHLVHLICFVIGNQTITEVQHISFSFDPHQMTRRCENTPSECKCCPCICLCAGHTNQER